MGSYSASKTIRVAMLIQAYYPHVGGAERQLAALAPLLQERGVDIHILTRRYSGLRSFEMIDGVPVYRLPIPGPKPVASLAFTLSALPLLYRLKPDLIHAHELLSPTTTAVLAKRIFGMPVAAKVLRGGKLGDIAKLNQRRSGRQRLAAMRRHVDAFITISREIDGELANLNIPQEKRPFIPNGVDIHHFAPIPAQEKQILRQNFGLPDGPLTVFTGRLAKEKQIDQLIAIWPRVRIAHPQASLLLLGTGDQEAELKRQAGDGIIFYGAVDDVAPFLQCADLFVLPSATEGLSNALLEAMAAGLPVITSNVGGAPDLISHGHNGLLISPDNSADWAECIIDLLNEQRKREGLGQQARQKMVSEYALSSVADRLRGLYERLLTAPDPLLQPEW
ncbi:MAG: glycosyltransferase family 4 protein [Ardenticatenaceae bacterium]|nr:glycosyltransferase family 4 protein [Ardenticatenaceae bacterium]MCB9443915.1 glycosyltransferase family 4 protein [Ardenticatenaceae bacterium]